VRVKVTWKYISKLCWLEQEEEKIEIFPRRYLLSMLFQVRIYIDYIWRYAFEKLKGMLLYVFFCNKE